MENRYYFMGADPAPALGQKSDDGALAIGRARPRQEGVCSQNLTDWRFEFVWAQVLRKASAREWSGLIHKKHRHFGLSGILMDPNGGGQFIMRELDKSRQVIDGMETECMPILCPEYATEVNGTFILNLFKRGDHGINLIWPVLPNDSNLVHAMHIAFQEAVNNQFVSWPPPFTETPKEVSGQWPEERRWASINLEAMTKQLTNLYVVVNDDGTWVVTKHGALTFAAHGRKDIIYAGIYAYVRFLIWLKSGEFEMMESEDEVRFYAS